MSQEQDEAKDLNKQLHKMNKNDFWSGVRNSAPVLIVKGIWMFAEGTALVAVSSYAIYQGHYAHLPKWGSYALTIAGVLVLVPAGMLLGRFFRNVAKS